MRSLTKDQITQIKERYAADDWATNWAIFHVSVFNAGAVIDLTFGDSPEEIDPDTWNGYDMSIHVDDVVTLLDRLKLL